MCAEDEWSQCNAHNINGIYIWTAGQWENPQTKSKFLWKWTVDKEKLKCPKFKNQAMMDYTNWRKEEPNNYGGHEACINLFKKYDYMWNDEPCNHEYCFVCEDRSFPI